MFARNYDVAGDLRMLTTNGYQFNVRKRCDAVVTHVKKLGSARPILEALWLAEVAGIHEPATSEKTTMAKPKKPEKTTDPKLWDKPRKITIFLMPTNRKPTN